MISRILLGLIIFQVAINSWGQEENPARNLISEIGCGSCHTTLGIESTIRQKTPDLSYAGLRYNPAYLYFYLQNPYRIRQHIGNSRMPDFHLNEEEALAMALFLETQQFASGLPSFPPELDEPLPDPEKAISEAKARVQKEGLICLNCHTFGEKGKNLAVDLGSISYRLKPEWVKRYLVAPHLFDGPETTMPALFFRFSETQDQFIEITSNSAHQITALVEFFLTINSAQKGELEQAYDKAKAAYPHVDAALGEKIFRSQNCIACHTHERIKPWSNNPAPDLTLEADRVQQKWLRDYLRNPKPIRPFGFYPGSGSRMPDFKLSENEIELISDYLISQQKPSEQSADTVMVPLSAFSMTKARALIERKLSCLGCHQLGKKGGRIGPDLSNVPQRLKPSYVYQMVENPRELQQHTVMPKILMAPPHLRLIIHFLLQADIEGDDPEYLSLVENPIYLFDEPQGGKAVYAQYCAPCHGANGDGKGFNAKYLDTTPTVHADKLYMSRRSNHTIFDGIFGGGYILNRSHLMPPFGQTLQRSQIWGLVTHIRDLCECVGPSWSGDNE